MRRAWDDLGDWLAVFAFAFRITAGRAPRPRLLIFFGYAPGDDLLCTAVFRELRKRGEHHLMMVTDHTELFAGNQDVAYVQPLWRRYDPYGSGVAICRRIAWLWGGRFIRPEYAPLLEADHSRPPPRHIVAEMCAAAGVAGPVRIRPYLTLREEERSQASWAQGLIVIQSSGMAARHPIRNKQWPAERFQDVVDALAKQVTFIQIGSPNDPPLRGAKDLRGATGVRDAAAILFHARLFVGQVGFLMHLARAVECPGVIVFGSREAPWQSGYSCNLNLYSAVPCAPCWRWNGCAFDRRCLSEIEVDDVLAAIREMLARPRGPLAVETVEIAGRPGAEPGERAGLASA